MLFFASLLFNAFAAPPTADVLEAAWSATGDARKAHSQAPISLLEKDFHELASGHIVKRRMRIEGADRGVGAMWSPQTRNALWIGILDDTHDTLIKQITEHHLPRTESGRKRLYQHLDVPWPFTNRQWALEIWNSPDLTAATDGRMWERVWALLDPSVVPEPDPKAIWTPVNDGGWILLDVGGGTLLVYHLRTLVGGAVPDEIATRWAMTTLDDMLDHVAQRALEIPEHYDAAHFPINGGDDQPVPSFP